MKHLLSIFYVSHQQFRGSVPASGHIVCVDTTLSWWRQGSGKSKITQLDHTPLRDEYVLWFNVSVDDLQQTGKGREGWNVGVSQDHLRVWTGQVPSHSAGGKRQLRSGSGTGTDGWCCRPAHQGSGPNLLGGFAPRTQTPDTSAAAVSTLLEGSPSSCDAVASWRVKYREVIHRKFFILVPVFSITNNQNVSWMTHTRSSLISLRAIFFTVLSSSESTNFLMATRRPESLWRHLSTVP